MSVLDEIMAHKRDEVAERKRKRPLADVRREAESMPPIRPFADALISASTTGLAVIAEAKKASPSKGLIRPDFEPAVIASSYERGGATCLSVLTDEHFFEGHDDYLVEARNACALPTLRKDFIADEYQLHEARALGADCVLLIVSVLDIGKLTVLYTLARGLGLDVLIEVHNEVELDAALSLRPRMIGINNRNLSTFETSIETTLRLKERIPEGTLTVTESGIHTPDDVATLTDAGVRAFLVGEAFMRAPDPGSELARLFT